MRQVPIRELEIDAEFVAEYLSKRLRQYVLDYAGRSGGVIGLSGGLDSTVTAYLAVRALSPERVRCLILPTSVTPKEDLRDAMKVIEELSIPEVNYRVIDIEPIVEEISSDLSVTDRVVRGNVTARVRMIMLHALAASTDSLVIGTSDKSELTIGYFTKYGDAGVDVMPIADLYKTQVKQLGKHLGIPEEVIVKLPSPRLWKDHLAIEEIGMSYELLDSILYLRFDEWLDPAAVAEELGIDKALVVKVEHMVRSSQHKRMMPEVFRVGRRSHGSDWRYPREWY
ncbi:MAG: NAD+ synthase [Thaumarchaeota archaeon]|nr:NAD+ synthase [Candidatus Calditenuaceae archaeon]MDW8186871.1 NAD+ synthase [Nitrososphaerota archaeon]